MVRRSSSGLLLHRIGVLAAVCGGLVLLVEAGPFSPEADAALTTLDYAPRIAPPARRLDEGAAPRPESVPPGTDSADSAARGDAVDPTGPSKAGIASIPWPEDGFEAAGSKLTPPAQEGPSFLLELPALRDTSLALRRDRLSDEPDDSAAFQTPGFDIPGFDIPGFDIPGFDTPGFDMPGFDMPGFDMPGFDMPGFDMEEPSFAFGGGSGRSEVDSSWVEFQIGLAAGTRFGTGDASGWLQPIVPTSEEERYCLAQTIYFESRGEPELGKLAVAHVVMNRVADQRFPKSICRVVRQGGEQTRYRCQFTWWCDGLSDRPADLKSWRESRALAESVYWGHTKDPTDGALWYHADYVAPRWAMAYRRTSQIGRHIFYQPTPQERRLAARGS